MFEQADLKVHGKGMMALARLTTRGHPRVGLVVSKKNVKLAVDRNRFKRLVRESVRHRQDHLPSVDIVILAKRGVQDIDNETLFRQLHGMWKRLQHDAKAVAASPPNGVTRDA